MENIKPIKELELYIIRHGQSMGNAGYDKEELTLKEENDPYLTELGLSQAAKAAEALENIYFDAVYSSALLRAVQTAAEIIKKQPKNPSLNILPLLTEVSVNDKYNGAEFDEIKSICPSARLADGVKENDSLVCHNEFNDEVGLFERAKEAIEIIRSKYTNGEKVAVVCHAAFMTFLVFYIMGYEKSVPAYDINFANTSVTKITFYEEGTNIYGDIVFEYINSTRHLTDKY